MLNAGQWSPSLISCRTYIAVCVFIRVVSAQSKWNDIRLQGKNWYCEWVTYRTALKSWCLGLPIPLSTWGICLTSKTSERISACTCIWYIRSANDEEHSAHLLYLCSEGYVLSKKWQILSLVKCLGSSGPDFIIKDLPSVLIQIIADQLLNDSLCCSNKYNWCLCRFIGKLYILLQTILIKLFEIL